MVLAKKAGFRCLLFKLYHDQFFNDKFCYFILSYADTFNYFVLIEACFAFILYSTSKLFNGLNSFKII